MNRDNFFYKKDDILNTLIIGRAGKTICKTIIKSILKDEVIIVDKNETVEDQSKICLYDIAIHHLKEFEKFKSKHNRCCSRKTFTSCDTGRK